MQSNEKIIFHARVSADVDAIMAHYRQDANDELANDFFDELMYSIQLAAEQPELFNLRQGSLRRVNLERFPYNFLFRILGGQIQILVVRHHARRPNFGSRRR